MPRRLVEKSNLHPYHIYARSNNKDWFDLDLAISFDIYTEVSNKVTEKYKFNFHNFVLMSNHFHMLVSTPEANISEGMRYFMTETSRKIARKSSRINRIYGARYGSSIIKSSVYYSHVYKYVYRNPVEAKICTSVEDYKYSTLNNHSINLNKNKNGYDEYMPTEKSTYLRWLNEKPSKELNEAIKKALGKRLFKFTRNQKTGKMPDYKLDKQQ